MRDLTQGPVAGHLGPALWMTQQPHTQLHDYWRVGIVAVLLQCAVSLVFLMRMFRRKLPEGAAAASA